MKNHCPSGNKNISMGALFTLFILLISACQPSAPACPPKSVTYLPEGALPQAAGAENENDMGHFVEINGKEIMVDQVVQGILCRGDWQGTVYVPCQVQVYEWEENPLFLENCDLDIAPGTVVYVAAHNNQAYYQGCSCHTGDMEQ